MIDWKNPYSGAAGKWSKGGLHAHTSPASQCGRVKFDRVLEMYEDAGFDFISISDHMTYTCSNSLRKIVTLPGIEWNAKSGHFGNEGRPFANHMGLYSLDPRQLKKTLDAKTPEKTFELINADETLAVLNHPNWLVPHHYPVETIYRYYNKTHGMEIYNALIERHFGDADATMKWDMVLTVKGPYLGFASDDSHLETDIGRAWLMVRANDNRPDSIFSAIKNGRFYCSSGVNIYEIGREGDEIYCVSDKDVHIDLVGEYGKVFAFSKGRARINANNAESAYLRFVLYGPGKTRAWSQPFYR